MCVYFENLEFSLDIFNFEYLEYSGWNVGAVAFIGDNHIGWIRPVKLLIGAEGEEKINC